MQTYTHGLIGLVIGKILFRDDFTCQFAVAFGAITPDLTIVPQYILDKSQDKKILEEISDRAMTVYEVSHSLPFWTALFIGPLQLHVAPYVALLALGAISHVLVDGLTHGGKDFISTDTSLVWPFHRVIPKLGSVIGIWEYRSWKGCLKAKPAEVVVLTILTIVYLLLW